MTVSAADHAAVVRQFVRWDAATQEDALAALDALVAERDEAHTLNASLNQQVEMSVRMLEGAEATAEARLRVRNSAIARAEAAEAERDKLREALREADKIRDKCRYVLLSDGSYSTSVVGPSAWDDYSIARDALGGSSE